jgi:hypothetical protein
MTTVQPADNVSRTPHTTAEQGGRTMREQEPSGDALEEIRAHLEHTHGLTDFDLQRDVAYPDNTPEYARVAYLPETRFARARFICSECNGGIFIHGQPSHSRPARSATLLHAHPQRGIIVQHGVHDASSLALLVNEWNRGNLGQA